MTTLSSVVRIAAGIPAERGWINDAVRVPVRGEDREVLTPWVAGVARRLIADWPHPRWPAVDGVGCEGRDARTDQRVELDKR